MLGYRHSRGARKKACKLVGGRRAGGRAGSCRLAVDNELEALCSGDRGAVVGNSSFDGYSSLWFVDRRARLPGLVSLRVRSEVKRPELLGEKKLLPIS